MELRRNICMLSDWLSFEGSRSIWELPAQEEQSRRPDPPKSGSFKNFDARSSSAKE